MSRSASLFLIAFVVTLVLMLWLAPGGVTAQTDTPEPPTLTDTPTPTATATPNLWVIDVVGGQTVGFNRRATGGDALIIIVEFVKIVLLSMVLYGVIRVARR